jgi:oxygen-independent coproporphyrinogen III oxidase
MAGYYISWPFCAQKCTYCNFASGVLPSAVRVRYLQALCHELRSATPGFVPETLYFGGGTPGSMNSAECEAIAAAIPRIAWREATMEAAPGGLSVETIQQWQALGINRVSFGVQSFDARELARSGRRHSAETVQHEVALLRANGLPNFNIDLIAGLAGQTAESWNESLNWIERLQPPHVSVYILEVDEDSRLGNELLLGGVRYGARDVPSEEQQADSYQLAVERLASMGIARYEISNFAQPGAESLHNLKYWRQEPWLGFGSDAHSTDGAWRWSNEEQAERYVERMEQTGSACNEREAAHPEEERFFVGLRLMEGVTPTDGEWQRWAAPIARFESLGLLERQQGRLRLTPRGVLLSNEVFAEFLT